MASKSILQPRLHGLHTMHAAGIFSDMTVDGPEIGILVVLVDRAKNLPDRNIIGKQNPYCAVRLGKEAKKTDTDHRGGQRPQWNQELRYTVHDSPDYYQLKVSVFNDNKKTDLIGETRVNLRDIIIPGGGQNDIWYHLLCKGKYAGEIRAKITYCDMRSQREKQKPIPITGSSVVFRTDQGSTSLKSLGTPDKVSNLLSTCNTSPSAVIKSSPSERRSKNVYKASTNVDCSPCYARFSTDKLSFHDKKNIEIKKEPISLSQYTPSTQNEEQSNRPCRIESRERLQHRNQRTPRVINSDIPYKYPSVNDLDTRFCLDDSPPPPPIHRCMNKNKYFSLVQTPNSTSNLVSNLGPVSYNQFDENTSLASQIPNEISPLYQRTPYSLRDEELNPSGQLRSTEKHEKYQYSSKENYLEISTQEHKFGPRQYKGSCMTSFL